MNNQLKEQRNYDLTCQIMNRITLQSTFAAFLLAATALFSCSHSDRRDLIREGFLNPPDSSRPGVYWYFMDGNIDRAAMTADLESMKKAGIGYVLFLEVNVGVPRGKVDFLTDEWQDLYLHAVNEAKRLGIKIVLGSGPGWAGSGGPWVTPSQSMTHLVASDTSVTGPASFNGMLAVPKPMKPFFGEESLTPALKKIRDNWYEDVVTLAFPSPETDYRIKDIDDKALYYRAPYTSQPGVLPYIPSLPFFRDVPGSGIDQGKILNITGNLGPDGTLNWHIPPGKWTIMRFGRRNNGAVTRPAPAPGLGFECDKFDTASFNAHYNAYIGKLLKKTGPEVNKNGGGWTMIHIDSWEMGAQNWSPHFREQFIKRRGYDPLLFLPVYTGRIVKSREVSERFLWDLRQTSSELIVENHAGHFKDLGRRSGFRLSIEPYDMNPSADLDLGGIADVPMCEFWSDGFGFNSSFSCFEATSIAHVAGLPVVAAESFTADSPEAWKKYPGNMKNQGDWAFCAGINRFFYHTFAHKPLPEKYRPGMTMGPYGVHWDRGQTWWPMAEEYHKYISRCQFILSRGKAVADILYLTPEGAPQVFLPPKSALEGTSFLPDRKGYSFDGCSPSFLMKNAGVRDNCVVFPGGASYRLLVLPDVATMTPELLETIASLIKKGATVAGNPPVRSPSLVNYPACDSIVRSISEIVWGVTSKHAELIVRKYGSGRIISGDKLINHNLLPSGVRDSLNLYPDYGVIESLLGEAGERPDFKASGNIRYTHRSLEDRDIYFISNRSEEPVEDTCYFRCGSRDAEIWNPVTAGINSAGDPAEINGFTALPVRLDSYQSYFIVFYHNNRPAKEKENLSDNFAEKETLFTLSGPWNVSFDTAWGGPEHIIFSELEDWSERTEPGIRYYSGTAVYKKSFDMPVNSLRAGKDHFYLDLGKVKNIGRVKLNGHDLGIVWTSPWQVNITGLIREKGNELEVSVANLWINRLIGDEFQPWDGVSDGKWPEWLLNGTQRPTSRYTFTTHRYYRQNDPLSESGLIGPVSIKSVTAIP
jgi:hypothetical protein